MWGKQEVKWQQGMRKNLYNFSHLQSKQVGWSEQIDIEDSYSKELIFGTGEQAKQTEQVDQKEQRNPQPHIPITKKRKNRAAEQTLREAQEYIGDPQDSVRQRKAP